MKRYDQALAASDRALTKAYGPRKMRLYNTRVDIYVGMGDSTAAKHTLEQAIGEGETLPGGAAAEREHRLVQEAAHLHGRRRPRGAELKRRGCRSAAAARGSSVERGSVPGADRRLRQADGRVSEVAAEAATLPPGVPALKPATCAGPCAETSTRPRESTSCSKSGTSAGNPLSSIEPSLRIGASRMSTAVSRATSALTSGTA